jgi:GNAT superfamily N-acetyltransferase
VGDPADRTDFTWRGPVAGHELVALAASHGDRLPPDWWDRVAPRSLGWVSARDPGGALIGFVNVAWDGAGHAFVLDTKVDPGHQRRGIATELVAIATRHARRAGCEWLHVDFEEHLRPFYLHACGFTPTAAGLIHLPPLP